MLSTHAPLPGQELLSFWDRLLDDLPVGHEGGWFNAVLALLHSLKLRLLFCSRKNSLGLIVALDYKREAKGELYWDDGASAGRLPMAPHCSARSALAGRPAWRSPHYH